MADWLDREALVVVKAYPNPSAKYHETVCVAAITKEEGFVRLYPVQFRFLPVSQRFKKYQRIRLRMKKHKGDARPESYCPDESSFQLLDVVGSESGWSKRREWIDPIVSQSMCDLRDAQQQTRKSLGVFRPREIVDLVITDADEAWSAKRQAELDQMMLFDDVKTQLEKIPFAFKYEYFCNDARCKGHLQSIIDWELMELYRKVRDQSNSSDEIKAAIRNKYLGELCGEKRETCLFVGNHSAYPATFMVLGVFWPPKRRSVDLQRTMF